LKAAGTGRHHPPESLAAGTADWPEAFYLITEKRGRLHAGSAVRLSPAVRINALVAGVNAALTGAPVSESGALSLPMQTGTRRTGRRFYFLALRAASSIRCPARSGSWSSRCVPPSGTRCALPSRNVAGGAITAAKAFGVLQRSGLGHLYQRLFDRLMFMMKCFLLTDLIEAMLSGSMNSSSSVCECGHDFVNEHGDGLHLRQRPEPRGGRLNVVEQIVEHRVFRA